jgi:hypothetical protein
MLDDPDSNAQIPRTEDLLKEGFEANPVITEQTLSDQGVIDEWNQMSIEEKSEYEKKLVRKLDFRLIPWPTFLYLLSFLDRTNIGNAKIQGVYVYMWKSADIRS